MQTAGYGFVRTEDKKEPMRTLLGKGILTVEGDPSPFPMSSSGLTSTHRRRRPQATEAHHVAQLRQHPGEHLRTLVRGQGSAGKSHPRGFFHID